MNLVKFFRPRIKTPTESLTVEYDANEAIADWELGYARVLVECDIEPSPEIRLAFLCGWYAGKGAS
jgi:hypothetical protein